MSDVEIRIDDKIAASISTKLQAIQKNAGAADVQVDKLKATLASVSNTRAFQKDASEAEKLKNTLRSASQVSVSYYGAVSKLNTAIDHQGRSFATATTKVQANTAALKQNSTAAHTSTGAMRGLIGALGAYVGAQAFLDTANAAQQLSNQLRTITNSQAEYNRLQTTLMDLSNRTRTGIEQTTQLYVNFSKVLQNVGIEETELLRMVETLNKGFQVGGRTAAEAAGSTRQFIQALQSGVLRGEEFNSIMEQMPVEILEALAKAAGVTVEQLRKTAEQGLLTRDVLREALGGAAKEIDALFARTTPTINNAFTTLRNNAIDFFMQSSAAGDTLAKVIYMIADNLHIAIPLVIGFAAAWALVKLVQIILDLYNMVKAMTVFIATNAAAIISVGLWVAAILLAVAAAVSLAQIIAHLTGNGDAFNNWLADSAVNVINYGKSIMDSFGKTTTDATNEFTKSIEKAKTSLSPGITKPAADASKALASIGTSSKTAADAAVTNIKRIVNTLDTLIWKMRDGEAQAKKLYAALAAKGGSSGSFQTLSMSNSTNTGSKSSIENITGKGVPGYAKGGQFMVAGRSGRDTNPVGFMATKGERVTVETKAQQRAANQNNPQGGGTVINFNVYANDADSFRRSRSQVASDFARIVR